MDIVLSQLHLVLSLCSGSLCVFLPFIVKQVFLLYDNLI